MSLPAFLLEVTITTSNQDLDVWDSVGGDQTVALPASTYENVYVMCGVLQALVRTLGGVYGDLTCTVNSSGKVVFDVGAGDTFKIKNGTGANAATSLRDVLGFAHSDTADAQTQTSDYQHQRGWYANEGVKVDSKNRERLPGPGTFIAMDATGYKTSWNSGDHILRELELQYITPAKFFSDEADTNEAFQDWWLLAASGVFFTYYADASDLAGSDAGTWILVVPDDADLRIAKRESPGAEYYQGVKLNLQSQD